LSCVASVHAQDASQLGFSDLQAQANALVEKGQLEAAMPLLKELINRVEKTQDSDIKLDFPIFLVGTAHIQRFVGSNQASELNEALTWYDKLEKDYPDSPKLKDALLKKIDVLRVLKRNDDAVALMQKLISGGYSIRLSYSERIKLLRDLVQVYYGSGKLEEGLPYFGQLVEEAHTIEDKALGAAASFEALVAAKRLDDAIRLIPLLAKESEVRYSPRLNVAFLKTSDTLVEAARFNDTAILLNLIKTTDIMIEYHESQLAQNKAKLEQRLAFDSASDAISKLQQEIKTLEANIKQLKALPTLRNDLLVRRARNYTKTARRYEAFWMFFDLMKENPNDQQIQFFSYASFANALQLKKEDAVLEIGRDYRSKFPDGDYYSDISAALANLLLKNGHDDEFLALVADFLSTRPVDAVSSNLLAQWASFLLGKEQFQPIIEQTNKWLSVHQNSIFEDGLYYWKGLALLQTAAYPQAAGSFDQLLQKFPTSLYAEDALLRKGTAQFYAQEFETARDTLYSYIKKYPQGASLDQAYFFLGEVENLAGNYELALQHFKKADSITQLQDVHDSSAFRIGTIFETLTRYEEMVAHFKAYIGRFAEDGRLTDAIYELGRGYEFTQQPNAMLALFRESIQKYITLPDNAGVDALIEGYAEKYNSNQKVLTRTVAFLDKLESDPEFRNKIITDRGFLFELFYTNPDLDQTLYNRLRHHPQFNRQLADNLTLIDDITSIYRDQFSAFPKETPEDFFRSLLPKYQAAGDRVSETRILMGLYRSDIVLEPIKPYDTTFLAQLTPRALLYVADYSRHARLDFALEAWNAVLTAYPDNDAAIVSYMRLADVSEQRGDKSGALNYLEAIEAQFPGSPQLPLVILRQGELLTAMGQADNARLKYQYILKVPNWRGIFHARAHFQIGESYLAEKAYPEAHGFFERTFLGYSTFTEWCARAYLADAEALIGMDAKADAIATLKEGLDLLKETAPAELTEAIAAKLKELQP
jgi:TolA-binding protein